ncbi:MAG TPA: hypothetical protein VHB21_03560, partial [Minicystis sp.]|nr:hypothetical protein [Minicystis sp.]
GCVQKDGGGIGVCRAYCCGDVEACETDTWCVPQHMVAGGPKIPVCIPETPCSLLDDSRPCSNGLICTIVRHDGTTSCVEPGTGMIGDDCPCAQGFVCSPLTETCLQLCHLNHDTECPDGGVCVAATSGYPDGIGTCAGGNMSAY